MDKNKQWTEEEQKEIEDLLEAGLLKIGFNSDLEIGIRDIDGIGIFEIEQLNEVR